MEKPRVQQVRQGVGIHTGVVQVWAYYLEMSVKHEREEAE